MKSAGFHEIQNMSLWVITKYRSFLTKDQQEIDLRVEISDFWPLIRHNISMNSVVLCPNVLSSQMLRITEKKQCSLWRKCFVLEKYSILLVYLSPLNLLIKYLYNVNRLFNAILNFGGGGLFKVKIANTSVRQIF